MQCFDETCVLHEMLVMVEGGGVNKCNAFDRTCVAFYCTLNVIIQKNTLYMYT